MVQKLGLPFAPQIMTLNKGRRKILNLDDGLASDVFAPWIAWDQMLVGFAKGL